MDEQTKEKLVTELRDYLDSLPETVGESDGTDRTVDLYTLFTELAGLRNEVRLESRQLKRALDEFNNVFSTLDDSSQRMGRALETQQSNQATAVANAERGLLLALIDLRDRLAQAQTLAASHEPGLLQHFVSRSQGALINDLADGLSITIRRLDQSLTQYDVKPIKAVGEPVDPHRMRVATVQSDPGQLDGVVLNEVQRGYQRDSDVLRAAEVVANRIQDKE